VGAGRRIYFDALRLARVGDRALQRHARHGDALILNVHAVSPQANPYGPPLRPELFERLLAWLVPRTRVGTLRDLEDDVGDLRRPRVVLSFDDGLKDFVEHATPVLDRFGVRANQNVIGHAMQTGEAPWALAVIDLLGAAPSAAVRRLRVPGFEGALTGDDDHAKERFGAAITNHLKALEPEQRAPALGALREQLGEVPAERRTRMMDASDVAAARAAGHEIGSHSYAHESMEHLDDDAFLADFRRSREALREAGCDDITVYAFPNGSHRPGQADLLEREEVRHVLLVGERPTRPGAGTHTRLTLRGHTTAELRSRAAAALGVLG